MNDRNIEKAKKTMAELAAVMKKVKEGPHDAALFSEINLVSDSPHEVVVFLTGLRA